ncbi:MULTISPECIES: transporter substrate-binding domain-containing protein [unclassified Marinomonas]|uniref:transporter substrate-binding domain-containing protein n=1 Tax=unclassified Marinomonas TaxID=196814 RepID=UPI0009EE1B3C|nr:MULTISPECIES: transporter substrate-binding domain-containing protein [unclassified Marinomonas]
MNALSCFCACIYKAFIQFAWHTSLVSALILLSFSSQLIHAQALENIKEKGYITIGVKADYQPYGFKLEDGTLTGIEVDLAKDVAQRLGVELKLVPVKSSNRMRYLIQDQADLLIATVSNHFERHRVVSFVEPAYYSSGTNVLAWKNAKLHYWEQLHRKKVCGIRGAFYNHTTKMDYGAIIIPFDKTDEALLALRKGQCLAFVYDDSFIKHQLHDVRWQKRFEMPLNSIKGTPWGLVVKLGENEFKTYLKDIVIDWHASGYLIELEKLYGLKASGFTIKMHDLYK